MTGMALLRRLIFGAGTFSFLLCVYILCLNLQWPLSRSIVPPRILQAAKLRTSSSRHSEEPLERGNYTDQRSLQPPTSTPNPITVSHTPSPTKPAQKKSGDVLKSSTKSPTVQPLRAAGPTESPFIGDSYMSEDVLQLTIFKMCSCMFHPRMGETSNIINAQLSSLQMLSLETCSDRIRGRIKNTVFGSRFLEHLPVLQWAKHVTQEQYRRLSQYPGAHGWGGIDYNTLVETLSVLNSSANGQMLDTWKTRGNESECSRCAVVGNGGILKDSQKGKEIDGHHYVFRTNGAIIKGFEQDVGSRTTHYTFSTNTLMNSMRKYAGDGYRGPPVSKETRYVFLPDHDRDYLLVKAAATHTPVERGPERAKEPAKYFGEDVSAEKLKMYHPDFIRYLRNRFLRSNALKTKYKDIYRPSTGAVMLLAALHTCDQVSAYGFMTPDYKNYSDHYYDSSYHPVGFYINHDLRLEMNLWQQLHQAGLIRLYMHQ